MTLCEQCLKNKSSLYREVLKRGGFVAISKEIGLSERHLNRMANHPDKCRLTARTAELLADFFGSNILTEFKGHRVRRYYSK